MVDPGGDSRVLMNGLRERLAADYKAQLAINT